MSKSTDEGATRTGTMERPPARQAADARRAEETTRLARMHREARPPADCSPAIWEHIAPARAPLRAFRPEEAVITQDGNVRVRDEPMPDGLPARVTSPLSAIEALSCRGRGKGKPFTVGQHLAAEAYADVVHLMAASGGKLSNFDGMPGGSGDSVTDAMIETARRLRRMESAIGDGPALLAEGALAMPGRRTIRRRVLAWQALIAGRSLGDILAAHGWAARATNSARLRAALGSLLDDLHGL
ncbi:hypothetical protein [Pseudoroseicyclus sp. CXY001]|uniref:hypothetical protein n=1 Tax=Pseudoroseicyclus sp. CXY001 TaxID=3242492 RepID=UPI0035711E45